MAKRRKLDPARERLEGLLRAWEAATRDVERGYRGGLDDYLGDLDGRHLLARELAEVKRTARQGLGRRLRAADARLRRHTVPAAGCLWGEDNSRAIELEPEREWWYFLHPREPGGELRADLARWGLLGDPEPEG